MAVKKDEDKNRKGEQDNIILRCYECHGETANLDLKGNLELKIIGEVNCLEDDNNQEINMAIEPWKVNNFKLNSSNKN